MDLVVLSSEVLLRISMLEHELGQLKRYKQYRMKPHASLRSNVENMFLGVEGEYHTQLV